MKRFLPVIAVAIVLVIAIALWIASTHRTAAPSGAATTTPVTFPVVTGIATSTTGQAQQVMVVALNGGGTITTKDFIHNGVTIPDTQNAGSYYLAGGPGYCDADGSCPAAGSASDFIATYDSANQFFTIDLTSEPLGQSRRDAEAFLQTTLGITAQNMCRLKYYIGTVNAVNETYAGRNLGFNGCSGAVPLP